jgi:hypothetical protein
VKSYTKTGVLADEKLANMNDRRKKKAALYMLDNSWTPDYLLRVAKRVERIEQMRLLIQT